MIFTFVCLWTKRLVLLAGCFLLSIPCTASPEIVGIGLNKFDLANQYLGRASGGDGSDHYRKVTRAMGQKAIVDARDANVSYLRISATGFAPSAFNRPGDLVLWTENSTAYWGHMDAMMDDLEASGVRAVFTFIWNPVQFPAMTGETVHELLTDPESRSYRLAERYIREFIQRYKSREALLFYELTNELNLGADLDVVARCRKEQAPLLCEPKANYTTEEMLVFMRRLAELIRGLDPWHPISSGFSVPRRSAEHLRAKPEWVTGNTDFTLDSLEQFEKHLADIHEGVDVISVHLYPDEGNCRFGAADRRGTELLDIVKRAADKIGKPLFIGEFGEQGKPDSWTDSFTVRMLERIAALKVPYSAVWAWQFYRKIPYIMQDNLHTSFSLEPGFTDVLIDRIRQTNELASGPKQSQAVPDHVPPRVVLTWPLDSTTIQDDQRIHAVASDNARPVDRVEFWLDNNHFATDSTPPYETSVNARVLTAGDHTLVAKAFDKSGNMTAYLSRVIVGKPTPGGPCEVTSQ